MRPRQKSFHDLPPIAQEEIRESFARYTDSQPPPARLKALEHRLKEQVEDHPSGSYNVDELQRLLQRKLEEDAAYKIAEERRRTEEERERRKELQLELARVREASETLLKEERSRLADEKKTLEDRLEKRWDKRWGLLVVVVTIVVSALVGRCTGQPVVVPPESSTEAPSRPAP